MKSLFISREQALILANDLKEYSQLEDSSCRDIFKGFRITYGDNMAEDIEEEDCFDIHPIPEVLSIDTR